MLIASEGTISHNTYERRSRYIRYKERSEIQKRLQHESPSTFHSKQYLSLSQEQLVSGNRDGVGNTSSVFQRISSENLKSEQNDGNLIKSLLLLQEEINKKGGMGYIQRIHAYPFSVHCYTEMGIRIYHHMVRHQTLYCDATGTIVSLKNDEHNGKLLYYSIVLQHPSNKEGPIAVAEFISSEHTITAVSYFLECFRRQEALLFGFQNTILPRQVVIDRSLVLFQSFLRVYNLETASDYIHRCFRIVNGSGKEKDYDKIFVLACVSHVMNSAKKMCRKIFSNKDHYKFAMFCFSVMVNSWNLARFLKCLKACNVVFCSSHTNADVKEAYDCLLQLFKELGDSTLLEDPMYEGITGDGDEESRNDIMEEDSEEKHMSASLQKPFGSYFVKHLQAINTCMNTKLPVNPLYQPLFMEKLRKNWLSLTPFWSGILRGDPKRYIDWMESQTMSILQKQKLKEDIRKQRTSGAIEAWNLILKQMDHKKHRLRPDVFIKQHHDILCGRQLKYIDNLTGQPQRKITVQLKRKSKPLIEKWAKRHKTSHKLHTTSYYQNPPTVEFNLPNLQDIKETPGTFTDNPTNGSIETNGSHKELNDSEGLPKQEIVTNTSLIVTESCNELVIKRKTNPGLSNLRKQKICWLNPVIQALAVTNLSLVLQCIEVFDQTSLQRKFIEVHKNLEKSSKSPSAYPIIKELREVTEVGEMKDCGDCISGLIEQLIGSVIKVHPIFQNLMTLIIEKRVKCIACDYSDDETLDYSSLYVTPPPNGKIEVTDLWKSKLKEHTEEFVSYGRCIMCESKLQITESRVEFPEYQVINIQRNIDMKKLLTPISLPNIVVMSCNEKKLNYRLLAVIVHYGEDVHCGHYVTLVWNNIGWTIYDDTYTTEKNVFWQNTDIVQVKYSCAILHFIDFKMNCCTVLYGMENSSKCVLHKQRRLSQPEVKPSMKTYLQHMSARKIWSDGDYTIMPHLSQLEPNQWLSNRVVDDYIQMVCSEANKEGKLKVVKSLNPAFLPKFKACGYNGVQRWMKDADLLLLQMIVIPVHLQYHWILLIVNIADKQIMYFDTLHNMKADVINWIWYFICCEFKEKLGTVPDLAEWSYCRIMDLKQNNSSDCGVFVCLIARCMVLNAALDFSQEDISTARKLMLRELINHKILHVNTTIESEDLLKRANRSSGEMCSQQTEVAVKQEVALLYYTELAKRKSDDDDFVIYNLTEENLESWIQKEHTDPTEYIKTDPDCINAISCAVSRNGTLILCVADISKQCIVIVPEDLKMNVDKEANEFRRLVGIHHSLFHALGRKYSHWSLVVMKNNCSNRQLLLCKFLNVLFNHKRVCIDEQSLCDSDSNQFLPQFLLSERLIDTDEELQTKHEDVTNSPSVPASSPSSISSDYSTDNNLWQVEEDPEKNGLLVPRFINRFNPVDEEEELYSVPWGKENYIQQYPKLHRPSDKGEILSRQFIRDSISMFEPTIRLLYSGECTSCYSNPERSKIIKNLAVHLDMWPIQLQDMVDEIVYYLQGMQSDVYKTAATMLNNHTKFIIIPEMLTELIRCKYDLTYNEAVYIFLHRKLPVLPV